MNSRLMQDSLNQFDELQDYNLFQSDAVLQEILTRYGSQAQSSLTAFGQVLGSREYYEYADLANRHTPLLHNFDARGRRIDSVEFHPAWHQWIALNRHYAVHASPFSVPQQQSQWVDWAARFYLTGQIECGNLCPHAMTLGGIPLLQKETELWQKIGQKLLSNEYDARDIPIAQKKSIWLGMGMTEQQGGRMYVPMKPLHIQLLKAVVVKPICSRGINGFFQRQCPMRIWWWQKHSSRVWPVFMCRVG